MRWQQSSSEARGRRWPAGRAQRRLWHVGLVRQANWVGGGWARAERGLEFEVGERTGGAERWPRSGAEDARRALEAAASAGAEWQRLGRARRVAELRRVAEALETGAVSAALAPDLGLGADELRGRIDEELFRFREALELLLEGPEERGVGAFLAHWSDLVGGLGARVARSLAAGRTLVVRSDRRLPRAAQLLAQAFERAGLAGGPLCVLHGDQPDLDTTLAGSPAVASVRVREADSALSAWLPRAMARPETIWELWRVANASLALSESCDVGLAADDCVERFLGRSTTLSAQFPGSIARVLCPERLFSRFTEELLASLDRSPDARRPVPALDADLTDHLAHAWALGLDEGATPLRGEDPLGRAGGDGPAGLVFTNVAPRSGLARLTRPAPILALVRVPSGVDAAELQRELDGEPKVPVHGNSQP